jgi:hypothetical protein
MLAMIVDETGALVWQFDPEEQRIVPEELDCDEAS